ncbi:placenta growth factor isoform X5 [Columba livia]|uniref:placenta growth factor isoform X5 n=1 Tax=Columba livia TaxID=8932 RepID=UPI0031BA8886
MARRQRHGGAGGPAAGRHAGGGRAVEAALSESRSGGSGDAAGRRLPAAAGGRGAGGTARPVLTFREIWNRSFCRPLEQLVDVITEFPNEVEYIFRPSCVSLQRCGGCCGDEGLRCVPVETSTVTMQMWHTTQVASALPLASLLLPGFEPAASPSMGDLRSCAPSSRVREQDSGRNETTGLLLGPDGNTAWNQGLTCPICTIGSRTKGPMMRPGAEDGEIKQHISVPGYPGGNEERSWWMCC